MGRGSHPRARLRASPRLPPADGDRPLGPAAEADQAGQPLRPWTIPNLVGYLRLASIPVFLYLALGSGDGRDPAATILYFWIVVGDYVDGFLARATGQYSRLGALMDPVIDRLAYVVGRGRLLALRTAAPLGPGWHSSCAS